MCFLIRMCGYYSEGTINSKFDGCGAKLVLGHVSCCGGGFFVEDEDRVGGWVLWGFFFFFLGGTREIRDDG